MTEHKETPERLYIQRASEHARHELILDNIRVHLTEQPTANSALSVGRRYCADITAAADEIAREKRKAT